MEARALSRAAASPVAAALARSNPLLAPPRCTHLKIQDSHSISPAVRPLTRPVASLHVLAGAGAAARVLAGPRPGGRAGVRAGAGARVETHHKTLSSLTCSSPRPRAPLASSLSLPVAPATLGAPWPVAPRQRHPVGARAGLHSAFVLAVPEEEGEGTEEGQAQGQGSAKGQGQKQGQGKGDLARRAERAPDPWLTPAADTSPAQDPSPGSSSPGGQLGSGGGGELSSLPASELKRLLDMGGVSYRDCLEKGDLVRRLEGMRGFIPRAAQQELARALERASGRRKGSDADQYQRPGGTADAATPGPTDGTPLQGSPPSAPRDTVRAGTQGTGAELVRSFTSPGFQEEAWWLDAERNSIRRFQECGPSVVHIAALAPARQGGRAPPSASASPSPSPSPSPLDMDPQQIPRGTGSGFIWDKQGHIVTNYHVVMHGSSTRVTLSDASSWDARLVGVAANKDIAVLRIDAPPAALTPLPVGSSEGLQVGQHVLAIGNPFGLDRTLTAGIISGVGRDIRSVGERMIRGVVQTDASINPGNSGGPLLDSHGRLIGVNTAIFSPSGASAGVGFAIPVDTVRRTAERIVRDGKATRPALGIIVASLAQAAQVRVSEGVLVLGLQEGPVQRSGLRGTTRDAAGRIVLGDVIVGVNGNVAARCRWLHIGPTATYTALTLQKVQTVEDLMSIVEEYHPGQTVRVTVQRGSAQKDVYVELVEVDD